MNLAELTATAALAAFERGELTSRDYVNFLLERCRKHKDLNAFIHLDPDQALDAATEADEIRATGQDVGPLHGLPLVLKDNLDTADMPTTGGTPGLRDNRPKQNGRLVQTLVDAGMVILGKANMHELAYGITNNNAPFGPARNPYGRDRIPGGSSGGTGVAVGARLAPAGIGTDTGGSVRVPAALCGIAGLRPTLGRYSQAGIVPISHTRDTAGPMARSVADLALLDGVVTGGPRTVMPASLKGLRLGVPRGYYYENLDSALAVVVEDALKRLADAGVVLVEADVPNVKALDDATSFPVALYETVTDLNMYLRDHRIGLDFAGLVAKVGSPDVKGILSSLLGEGAVPEPVYREAIQKHRPALQAAYADYFKKNRVEAMIFPTTPLPAAKIGEDETTKLNGQDVPTFFTFIRNTDPASNAGTPGLSLPVGLTKGGLPVGMELDGPAGSDRTLLAIGLGLEAVFPPLPAPRL
jgi:Asp-tRNA(Asn)/Glu-tRNA(Gln) amidotransferase A subunit family amidase